MKSFEMIGYEQFKEEGAKILKITRCICSCETMDQYENAINMLVRYQATRPQDIGLTVMLAKAHDIAERQLRILIIKIIRNYDRGTVDQG